jgi:L-alanine-DL-glutamate epimerase-like enolase superfamily enzyme
VARAATESRTRHRDEPGTAVPGEEGLAVDRLEVAVYEVPTEGPEADGTLEWTSITGVVVEAVTRSGLRGLGYTVGDPAVAALVRGKLAEAVRGVDVRATTEAWERMRRSIRNLGRPGISSMAIAAVDLALWDVKARALGVPLHRLLGAVRSEVPIYGSGGLTSFDADTLVRQLAGWVEAGIPRVKMKVGKNWGRSWLEDLERVRAVRQAIGDGAELFVDANGAYDLALARRVGEIFALELGVVWFEEPVSSDDLDGLRRLRRQLPLDVTAGEYGYELGYFRDMIGAGAVDVVQADVGRCAGITEWLRVADLCAAHQLPFSAHCEPAIHLHPATVPANLRHIEYFASHVRFERTIFDGIPEPRGGCLRPDEGRPGNGLVLKASDAARFRVG